MHVSIDCRSRFFGNVCISSRTNQGNDHPVYQLTSFGNKSSNPPADTRLVHLRVLASSQFVATNRDDQYINQYKYSWLRIGTIASCARIRAGLKLLWHPNIQIQPMHRGPNDIMLPESKSSIPFGGSCNHLTNKNMRVAAVSPV